MSVKVSSIFKNPTNPQNLEVIITSEDKKNYTFQFTVNPGDVEVLSGDLPCGHFFLYSPDLALSLERLVWKVYDGECIKFPIDLGDLADPQEVIKTLKTRPVASGVR